MPNTFQCLTLQFFFCSKSFTFSQCGRQSGVLENNIWISNHPVLSWVFTTKLCHFTSSLLSQIWQPSSLTILQCFCIYLHANMPLLFLSLSVCIHPPKSKPMSISMRSINQVSLRGLICQKLSHWLQPNPAGSPPDLTSPAGFDFMQVRSATRHLQLRKKIKGGVSS